MITAFPDFRQNADSGFKIVNTSRAMRFDATVGKGNATHILSINSNKEKAIIGQTGDFGLA